MMDILMEIRTKVNKQEGQLSYLQKQVEEIRGLVNSMTSNSTDTASTSGPVDNKCPDLNEPINLGQYIKMKDYIIN